MMDDILPPAQGTPLDDEFSGKEVTWINPANTSLKERGKVLFFDKNTGMCVIKPSGFLDPLKHVEPTQLTKVN